MTMSPKNRTRMSVTAAVASLAVASGLLVAGSAGASAQTPTHDGHHAVVNSDTAKRTQGTAAKQIALNSAMRTLWADHMQWTYATVDAFFHNPQAVPANLDRLLRNQADIGNAVGRYYGAAAGRQMTALLTEHIQLAVPVLTAAKSGDQPALDAALRDWYRNATQIADFLTKANPRQWPASTTRSMMKGHIDQTTAYAVDLLTGDYAKAVADYDKAFTHMMDMADALSAGIVAQFPAKF